MCGEPGEVCCEDVESTVPVDANGGLAKVG
jgi:hypothetical protein